MDTKAQNKKKLYIGGGIMLGVILLAVGLILYVTSGGDENTGKPGYSTSTPTLQEAADAPGELVIEPTQIRMTSGPAGSVQGIATVSALYQDFRPTRISLSDPHYSWDSDCLAEGTVLPARSSCNIIISYSEQSSVISQNEQKLQPSLTINGQTNTPGGSVLPVEAEAAIIPFDSFESGSANLASNEPQSLTFGQQAPDSIDPYGPNPYGAQNQGMPPIDYSQAPIQPPQPTLTPKEQFTLARRQAVFSGMQPRAAAAHVEASEGSWGEIGIPTAISSTPQDMTRVVTMDRIITAALVRTYDSRTTQQVVAQVDRNVYGAHSRSILIPRGSRLIGTASGGAERVAISWTQLIRPDGARFVIEASTGDAMGQGGAPGRVNERILKRYGAILLGTALNVGTASAFDASESAGGADFAQPARNNGAIISDIVRQDIEKITADIVRRNSDIQPIVTVPAGTRITIIPTMDLQLRPAAKAKVQTASYPRAQNAGAPTPSGEVSVPNGQPSPDSQGIQFENPAGYAPQAGEQTIQMPSKTAPETGSVPPWGVQ